MSCRSLRLRLHLVNLVSNHCCGGCGKQKAILTIETDFGATGGEYVLCLHCCNQRFYKIIFLIIACTAHRACRRLRSWCILSIGTGRTKEQAETASHGNGISAEVIDMIWLWEVKHCCMWRAAGCLISSHQNGKTHQVKTLLQINATTGMV